MPKVKTGCLFVEATRLLRTLLLVNTINIPISPAQTAAGCCYMGKATEATRYMTYQEYQQLFETILSSQTPSHPYDDASYLNYTKLNKSRMKRWDQVGVLSEDLVEKITSIGSPQHWIIISEPWWVMLRM